MTAEGRTDRAIQATRTLMKMAMTNPRSIIRMTSYEVTPDQIEETILDILEYLQKTSPEENKEAEV